MNKKKYYVLRPEIIRKEVKKNCPGVYTLGKFDKNKFYVKYVGRSETCLRRRLLEHARKSFSKFFNFRQYSDKNSAIRNEVVEFFTYSDIDNKIKPSSKAGMIPGLKNCESELKNLLNKLGVA
tara:strand:+ start:195 stop:563 length:369 start_codon:yes stop_codon:yes gene_type:complete